jgi:hypothetical protein
MSSSAHQRVVRRTQVQADHIVQLLDQERIGGELEALGAVAGQRAGSSAPRAETKVWGGFVLLLASSRNLNLPILQPTPIGVIAATTQNP